jgi:hypothetical protein
LAEGIENIRRVSWSLIVLGSVPIVFALLEYPALPFLSAMSVVWITLTLGLVVGLGAIACAIHLKRNKLPFPLVTSVALVFGVLLMAGEAYIAYTVIDIFANCYNGLLGC